MPAPADPRHLSAVDQTQAASARSDTDETSSAALGAAPAAPAFGPPAEPGEVGTLGPYRVVKRLGHGGMGAVYAALDTRLGRRLALKVMLPQFAADRAARERFLREARAAAQVSHDNVVTVYEADERDGVPYIAMQFLEGYPLDEYLRKKGNPTLPQVLRIAREAAAGLAAAHKIGLVHRDVKPGNLWLEAPHGRVKVLDFGLAKPVDAEVELTKSGAIVGTPAFMSPEQARGERVDHRTDLFSLGAVLYRLCTGRLPFEGPTTMAVLMALGTQDPPPVRELNPAVPEPLAELIHQLLAKDPAARPQSAAEVVRRVRAIAERRAATAESAGAAPQVVSVPIQVTAMPEANPFADLDATATATAVPKPAAAPARRKPGRRWPWVAAGCAAFLAVVACGVVIIIRNKDGTETKIEVPEGATVTVKDKAGKTLAQVGPEAKPPAANADPDRKAAEWVLSQGGVVWVNGETRDLKAGAELPKERFTLTGVNLRDNKAVTDAGLANLKGCQGLRHLLLRDTQVTDAGLPHLAGCTALETIDLGRTPVTDAVCALAKGCPGMRFLDLGGTRVTDAGLAQLKGLSALESVDLARTRVTDAGLAHLKGLNALEAIGLAGTAVTDAGLAHLRALPNLRNLGLGGTKVTDAGLALFKGRKGLTQLGLDHMAVTDAGLAQLDLRQLVVLGLEGAKVTDAGLAAIRECKELRYLWVNGTRIGDAGLAHLKDLKALTHLHLDGDEVTDAGLAHLAGLKQLILLDLRVTKVTAKGLADFHAAVPGCKVIHDGGTIEPKR